MLLSSHLNSLHHPLYIPTVPFSKAFLFTRDQTTNPPFPEMRLRGGRLLLFTNQVDALAAPTVASGRKGHNVQKLSALMFSPWANPKTFRTGE